MDGIFKVIIIAAAVLICFRIFTKPMRLALKLLLNIVFGFIALLIINFFGKFIGVELGVNWLNAAVVGIFGLPGVALLLILRWLLLI